MDSSIIMRAFEEYWLRSCVITTIPNLPKPGLSGVIQFCVYSNPLVYAVDIAKTMDRLHTESLLIFSPVF